MKLEEIKFELGKDYNLKVRRTTVDFKFDKENFYNVYLSFRLNDIWFIKPKYY